MGFLKKIFSRSKKSLATNSSESNSSSSGTGSRKKLSRKEKKAIKNAHKSGSFLPSDQQQQQQHQQPHQQPHRPAALAQDKPVISPSPSPTNDYVRKPSFSAQRNQSQQQHQQQQQQQQQQHGSGSTGTLSPNESRSPRSRRSPHSLDDSRDHDDGIDRYATSESKSPLSNNNTLSPASANSNANSNASSRSGSGSNSRHGNETGRGGGGRYHQQPNRSDRNNNNNSNNRHNNRYDHGMVEFGGENAFSRSTSPNSYADNNDENTNYSNNRKSSPTTKHNEKSSLNYDQVQKLEQQTMDMNRIGTHNNRSNNNNNSNNHNHNNHNNISHHPYDNQKTQEKANRKMLQLTRLPNGQLAAMDRMSNSSPLSASSEFDLSTDAEDNEYNHIRQTASGSHPHSHHQHQHQHLKPMLEPPPHSPNSADVSDDDIDNLGGAIVMSTRSKHYFSDSDHESTLNSPSNGSLTAKSNSPSVLHPDGSGGSANGSASGNGNHADKNGHGKSRFTFDNEFEESLVNSKRKGKGNGSSSSSTSSKNGGGGVERPPSPTAFQKINKTKGKEDDKSQLTEKSYDSGMSPRALAIKAAQNLRAHGKNGPDTYADSTDSEFDPTTTNNHNNNNNNNNSNSNGRRNRQTQMTSTQNIMNDLLPPRKTRSAESESSSQQGFSQNKGNRKNEGVIENFADFETFANNEFGRTSKSVADNSPVSELLAQAQQRRKNRKGASQSVNSEPVLNAAMLRQQLKLPNASSAANSRLGIGGGPPSEAKRKLQKRKMEKEKFLQMLNDAKNGSDDDSDKEKDVNESWLIDEVTGALGPRGITADLESLGEKSNRSKTSLGNKSHRSHRSNRSYRSHKSSTSRRRSKRSDESVGSRHSRSSRYSVKSTKSYVSQMSQESRSVANDLIRLEMQLAMVGANLKSGENGVKKQLELDVQRKGLKDGISVGESSIGLRSYSSRKSNRKNITIPKRSKTTVKAPPGKLGIILANRTDSKGTVVSGVRTTSVLADKISPGDRIIAIDGEDVSRMTVPEITAIMARKTDFERILTVLITPPK